MAAAQRPAEIVPEVDRAGWFTLAAAHEKINAGQRPLLDRLKSLCASVEKL